MNQQYREYIKDLAKHNKNVVFYNSGTDMAALVMATIFERAKKLKIYAGCFSGHISDKEEYRIGIEKFLSQGGTLEILLSEEKLKSLATVPKIFDVFKYYSIINPDNISVKTHTLEIVEGDDDDFHEIHFTVGDGKMYRIEDNIETFAAHGNFNDKDTSEELSGHFDKIFKDPKSKEYNLFTNSTSNKEIIKYVG